MGKGYNTTGRIPTARTALIDPDTPKSAYERTGYDGEEYELVFSDEFNVDGRTFWPGDDPFWEAVDLHYHVTGDKEWYDPDAATTANGSLVLTINKMDPALNHNLNYRSAMIQSWNKFCFTGCACPPFLTDTSAAQTNPSAGVTSKVGDAVN